MTKEENIYTLINKVMGDVGGVEKNSRNTQQGYAFRGIDDLYAALHPPLVKYGVFFCTDVEKIEQTTRESKQGSLLTCTVLTVRFTFFAPDGSSIVVRTVGEGMDSGDKSCSKAMSTALKYALLQLFCIPTSEPKDSEHDSPEPMYKREAKSRTVDPATGEVIDEPNWDELVTIGKQFRWPGPFVKQWIQDQKLSGESLDNIYARGMTKFSQLNKKLEEPANA
jgi:hypothetical protein